jgi:iron-sulfur cluster insertion protein
LRASRRPAGCRLARWPVAEPPAGGSFFDGMQAGLMPDRYTRTLQGDHAMNAVAEMPAPLVFTESAAEKVRQLIVEEGNDNLKLRVFVQGGGCSGFQYGFTFDEEVADDDTTMTRNGVTLLIDAMSYQYLVGAEIDYKDDLDGAQFVIKNPNATTTCGCGSSFSV